MTRGSADIGGWRKCHTQTLMLWRFRNSFNLLSFPENGLRMIKTWRFSLHNLKLGTAHITTENISPQSLLPQQVFLQPGQSTLPNMEKRSCPHRNSRFAATLSPKSKFQYQQWNTFPCRSQPSNHEVHPCTCQTIGFPEHQKREGSLCGSVQWQLWIDNDVRTIISKTGRWHLGATYMEVALLHAWRSQDFLDMGHHCHARRTATEGTHSSLAHLWTQTYCPCQILTSRGVLMRFPWLEMEVSLHCRRWLGYDLENY